MGGVCGFGRRSQKTDPLTPFPCGSYHSIFFLGAPMASVRRSAVHLAVVPVGRAAGCSVPSYSSFISNRAVRWSRRPDELCQPDCHRLSARAARLPGQAQPGTLRRRAARISASRRLVRPRGVMLATQPYRASSITHPTSHHIASEAQRPAVTGCDKNSLCRGDDYRSRAYHRSQWS